MSMKKRAAGILSILLAAAMAASMAACSSGSGNGSSQAGSGAASSAAPAASGSGAASGEAASGEAASGEAASGPQENVMPIANGDVTLKIYTGLGGGQRQHMKDLSEHSIVKAISEETGLKFTFIHPPEGDDGTYFNTTLASGEYPDLFYTDRFNYYPGGAEGAMDDKILIDLDELIYQYAPNFLALVAEKGEEMQKWILGDGGHIIKFGTMFLPPFVDARVHNGLVVRKDWLEKYNLEAPETVEEYTNVLKTFKENGVEVPLALPRLTDMNNVNPIASAFGVCLNDYQHDDSGKVYYSRTLPEYKNFLELMNSWASAGYIDRDFISRTGDDANTLFFNGRAGMTYFHNATTKKALAVGTLEDPDYDVLGVVYPRTEKGSELHLSRQALSVNTFAWYVTTACKNPEAAVRFVDYLHTEPVRLMTAWGLGNEEFPTFTVDAEGNRTFTDFMQNNPEMDFQTARDVYTLGAFQVMYDDEMERQQYNIPQNLQIWEAWATRNDNQHKMPHVMTLTVDESREFTEIKTKMDNYADEMVYKFIFGEESLDKFDEFVSTLESLGSARAVELQQQAYDRFQAR